MKPRCFASLVLVLVLVACNELTPDPRDTVGPLPASVPAPADNPSSPEAVELGRLLFWDPILSGDRDVACASCHHPDFAYSDGLPVSIGVGGRGIGPIRAERLDAGKAARNAPSVLNTGFNGLTSEGTVPPEMAPMFWDMRARSLESQVLGPIASEIEMRGSSFSEEEIFDEVVARLADIPEYVTLFEEAYGEEGVSVSTLSRAIAAFERTLVSMDSSFDRYMAGDDDAMTAPQIRGLRGFIDEGCSRCHSGPMFSDFKLHELPVPTRPGDEVDLGAGERRFRTPSLRMVTRTAPYMHNGILESLEAVFDFYHNRRITDPLLGPDVEIPLGGADDMLLFFEAISDGSFDTSIPEAVPSGLPPGGP